MIQNEMSKEKLCSDKAPARRSIVPGEAFIASQKESPSSLHVFLYTVMVDFDVPGFVPLILHL